MMAPSSSSRLLQQLLPLPLLLSLLLTTSVVNGFAVKSNNARLTTTTRLLAIPALAKKAKEAELRNFIANGVPDDVMEYYRKIQDVDDSDNNLAVKVDDSFRNSLTRRRGTITVIAEFKRKFNGVIDAQRDNLDPEILSPQFREYGASAVAVLADERMGGCNYDDDLKTFITEQSRAHLEVPGPIPVINHDLIIDELQLARTAAMGGKAVTISYETLGSERTKELIDIASNRLGLECIVMVSTNEHAKAAVEECGAKMIMVINVPELDDMIAVLDGIPDDRSSVTRIAQIMTTAKEGLEEIELGWAIRDSGKFEAVWVCDVLYKGDHLEHPGSIIKSLKSKSSLKWASPKAGTGRGEGAREYLGDILM